MADNVEPLVKDKVPLDLFCKLQFILLHCDDYYTVTNEFVQLFFLWLGSLCPWKKTKASREARFISRRPMDEALAKPNLGI